MTVWTCWNLTFDRIVRVFGDILCAATFFSNHLKMPWSKILVTKVSPTLFQVHVLLYVSEGPYTLSQFTL